MENFVTNQQISQTLKDEGFIQEGGQFYWGRSTPDAKGKKDIILHFNDEDNPICDDHSHKHNWVRAFLTDELLEVLPDFVGNKMLNVLKDYEIVDRKKVNGVVFYYAGIDSDKVKDCIPNYHQKINTPANALGLLAIHLKKTGILKI